ncbi:suppressor of los1-1 [Paraconiothyrium brasiliense]|uniref:Suppressor of los1-1 n=1 Tax=Paraconiothyrium brasiliense TaxID=300254 RepID=A0ABR3S5V1_9PLEO
MGKPPNLYAFQGIEELAPSLRTYVLDAQNAAINRHGVFRVAVSGGSLPKVLGQALLKESNGEGKVQFDKWEIFYADERLVPLDHEDSNHRLVKAEILDKIPAELGQPKVFTIDVKYLDDAQELADQYEQTLVSIFAARDSVRLPMFDLLLLGCGPDGHTCSLFPGSPLLRETDAWVLKIEDSPKPPPKRITLSLPVVTHGIKIAFVATGGGKKDIMKEIFDTDDGRELPCGLVNAQAQERRLGQPASDKHNGNVTAPNRTHKRANSQNPTLGDTNGDTPNRRSFLPQRGLSKAVLRANGVAETGPAQIDREVTGFSNTSNNTASQQASVGDAQTTRPRPRSLYQTRASQQDTSVSGANGTAHSSRPTDVNNKPSASTGLSRTQSVKRPGVASQGMPPPGRLHTRTHSTTTPTGTRKESGEADKPATRAERPKSLLMTSAHTQPSNNVPAETATGLVRTSARLDGLTRSASTRPKPGIPLSRATASRPDDRSQAKESREGSKHEPKQPARPAFSTLQQHFTPRKTGKAPTSTFIHAPEPVNHALPPEIVALQNELLQLHLLHEPSASTMRQWELSAQKAFRMRFEEVASLYQLMQEKERFGQEQKNIMALHEWNRSKTHSGLVHCIQALSGPLHELPSLLNPGGRFFHVVEGFSKWVSTADEVWSDRDGSRGQGIAMHSLGGLGDAWKAEHAVMTRKLTAFSRDLYSLPPTVAGSSIAHIVSTCQSLVEGLLSELQIMQATETDVVAREKLWVEERLRTIAQDIVDVDSGVDEQAWRLC